MQQILDLHIHSKYSRACSSALDLENIDKACRIKGIDIIATGDFTHPVWFSNIEKELEEIGKTGLYKLKTREDDKVKFILSTELALIYKDNERCRRIHLVVMAPNIEAVKKLNDFLVQKGFNIHSDGRPILGMSAPSLVKTCISIDPKFLIYPAHIWTPWFAVFGSKSGFDSMEECFHDQTKHIYAYETGLSSDPEMNWRLPELDNLTLLSNSDAHSLPNLAREANIMELEDITYNEIYEVIKNKDLKKLKKTIEFYPEEGMYHFDGHRDCGVCFTPAETKKHKGICPKCKKPLVVGVLNRIEELATRKEGIRPKKSYPFTKLVELDKLIAESMNIKSRKAKKVQLVYNDLIKKIGSELYILMDAPIEEIKKSATTMVTQGVKRIRANELTVSPGFDGQYGVVRIFSEQEKKQNKSQCKLF